MSDPERDEPRRDQEPPPEDGSAQLAGLLRAFKLFLGPFLLSWALAYIGSNRELEWLYFVGLGGVGVSTLALMVWLIS